MWPGLPPNPSYFISRPRYLSTRLHKLQSLRSLSKVFQTTCAATEKARRSFCYLLQSTDSSNKNNPLIAVRELCESTLRPCCPRANTRVSDETIHSSNYRYIATGTERNRRTINTQSKFHYSPTQAVMKLYVYSRRR